MDRTILHCDCNGFYASVECALNPELKKVPMAVGGDPESRHGIILAKNELAKPYNIQTAETIWQAKQKCPNLVIVPPHHEIYRQYSKRVNDIYKQYTDLVEPFGIDESWLDVSGSQRLFGDGKTIADELRSRIKNEIGLTISVGVSFNKVFAKLGSDYKKPDATTVFSRENWKELIFPLPAKDLLYVGKTTENALSSMGIHTIGALAAADRTVLEKRLGKSGTMLYIYANGLDNSPVKSIYDEDEIHSVGKGKTFSSDISDETQIHHEVNILSENIAARMRRNGVKCSTVQVQIKNPQFRTISRQKKLERPTYLAKEISSVAMEIIRESWNMKNPIRMITVTGANIIAEDKITEQLSLFDIEDNSREKREHLEKTMDLLKAKFGTETISFGHNIEKNNQ
jgi:DNA polymerase-4